MTDEIREAFRMVTAPLGEPWSGRARYAAAMTLHFAGEMDAEVLEIYRRLSRLDHEDPVAVLKWNGIGEAWIARLAQVAQKCAAVLR